MAKAAAAWSGSWTALDFGEGPPPRMSTCLEAIGTHMYLFGGEASAHSSIPVDAHLWRIDTSAAKPAWEKVAVEGTCPVARVAAASAIVGSRMYIFGGTYIAEDKKETYLDDVWFFDTQKSTWSQVEKKGSFWPVARNYHQMDAAGSDLFVFGGCDEPGRINDVLRFDTKTGEWQELAPVNKEAGDYPCGRGGACLVAMSPEFLIVMFGYDGKHHRDVYGFDVKKKSWTPLKHTGSIPPARAVTQPRMVKPGVLFLFGGERDAAGPAEEGQGEYFSDSYVAKLKGDSLVWSLAQAWREGPKARGWFASAVVADGFYIFGGQGAEGFCADPMKWSFAKGKGAKETPLRRAKFGKVKGVNPASKGVNLYVKCIKAPEAVEGRADLKECLVGDDSGSVLLSLRSDAHAALCVPGAWLRVQNAHARMVKGYVRLVVDQWGVLKADIDASKAGFEEVNDKKNISAVEYELTG